MNNDTVELLKECSSGIKMGTASINDVIEYVKDESLRETLSSYKDKHFKLEEESRRLLHEHDCHTEEPPLTVKGMAWAKTNVKLSINPTDKTCAGLITDGCNMGVKSLNRYLNEYESADRDSRELAQSIISLEEDLTNEMKPFL